MKLSDANLGLESLIARVDEAFRVIVHNVSAALALTSAGHWFNRGEKSCKIICLKIQGIE